ncbi:cytochrome c [Paracoccus laeviglucosivorans]|uniref:Cytochrome c, mono-and diheme variants n=1 Tax=Paracoccus laeviglucosivorans TaxID=1197861 RepID=A0A521EC85_9RHOB|nr:cytochrome c [Paracoccus laeviglucosivorans]SMO81546.1 Cytochrome c, mono-and diheme variants [Paracoccus laeviglucosivorans]
MSKSLRIIAALAAVGVVGGLAFAFVPVQTTAPVAQLPDDWKPAEGQGKYVMYASDCLACHTADGGEPFAGGRAIASPMGTIWATNITPDPETGIGNWTLDQFRAALYDGIRADGAHLYPAMPYENYRKLTEEDVRALYDYFMHEVPAVQNKVEETKLSFPFNMRFGIRAWNWLALTHDAGFTPADGKTEAEQRGQYLVEGPAHCAACHSPRDMLMAQDGVSVADANFLTGGVVDGWNAPALRGPDSAPQKWDVAEMAAYLATGRNIHSTANGEMGLVVEHSLQHLTDQDNLAIAAFLKGADGAPVEMPENFATLETRALPALDADDAGKETEKMLTEAAPDMALGPRLYLDNCAACHFVSGKGAPEIFPELAANHIVTGSEVSPLISVILNGAEVPSTAKRPMHLVMQGYADRMNDEEVAELSSFLRKAWGNDASAVTAAEVAAVRAKQPH